MDIVMYSLQSSREHSQTNETGAFLIAGLFRKYFLMPLLVAVFWALRIFSFLISLSSVGFVLISLNYKYNDTILKIRSAFFY